jgi:hypothetical protein
MLAAVNLAVASVGQVLVTDYEVDDRMVSRRTDRRCACNGVARETDADGATSYIATVNTTAHIGNPAGTELPVSRSSPEAFCRERPRRLLLDQRHRHHRHADPPRASAPPLFAVAKVPWTSGARVRPTPRSPRWPPRAFATTDPAYRMAAAAFAQEPRPAGGEDRPAHAPASTQVVRLIPGDARRSRRRGDLRREASTGSSRASPPTRRPRWPRPPRASRPRSTPPHGRRRRRDHRHGRRVERRPLQSLTVGDLDGLSGATT